MSAKLSIEAMKRIETKGHLNEEWIEVHNPGDTPFNAEGCSITTATSPSSRPRIVTKIKAGLIVQGNERVRIVTGSSGKKSHGEPPEGDIRNYHLFIKAAYLDRKGLIVRLMNRQHEVARAILEA